MKKNILKATLVAVFALIAGYNVYCFQKLNVMSDLALANVEALADGEEGISTGDACYNATYDIDKPKAVKCGSPCRFEPLDVHFWTSTSYCG